MKIDKSIHDDYATLTLKGEFDTFYCPKLQEEVESLLASGIPHVILNLRLVKFINSTALGAIIKAYKRCKAEGGQLVISQPSAFARDIITKLGINKLVPMFDDDEEARRKVISTLNDAALAAGSPPGTIEEGRVLITFPDDVRGMQANPNQRRFVSSTLRTIVGTMLNVDAERLQFSWSGAKNGLNADQASQLFIKGSPLTAKFQIKLFKKGYFELDCRVIDCVKIDDEAVKVTLGYVQLSPADSAALQQFAEDMEFLKRQIPGAR
ncbi:MAG TPA: STAS domain-containing protein [Planctomycetota bacterium]|nr:STAS domain-containing protein [Planctomycetota bacterium]